MIYSVRNVVLLEILKLFCRICFCWKMFGKLRKDIEYKSKYSRVQFFVYFSGGCLSTEVSFLKYYWEWPTHDDQNTYCFNWKSELTALRFQKFTCEIVLQYQCRRSMGELNESTLTHSCYFIIINNIFEYIDLLSNRCTQLDD